MTVELDGLSWDHGYDQDDGPYYTEHPLTHPLPTGETDV